MDHHSGGIEVESQVGQGTKVRVLIPRALRQSENSAMSTPRTEIDALSVLYIDDDSFVRTSIVALLRTLGVSVESAQDGRTGIQMFDSGTYDLVLTDLGMDEVTGWDVIRAVRERTDAVPVCIISGWNRKEINRHAEFDCIPDFVLTKPVTRDDLMSFLNTVGTDVTQES